MSISENEKYYIKHLNVNGLWGREVSFDIPFDSSVNILIGPNASGKTTILKLLNYTISARYIDISDIDFENIKVTLSSESSEIDVSVKSSEDHLRYFLDDNEYNVDLTPKGEIPQKRALGHIRSESSKLTSLLLSLTSAVWLPVNRRLPISSAHESEYANRSVRRRREREGRGLESVDLKLKSLLSDLKDYRLNLEQEISERYKQFERNVLQSILYDEDSDTYSEIKAPRITDDDKRQLLKAFEAADLLNDKMRSKIDAHFREARKAMESIGDKDQTYTPETLYMFPLIERTKRLTNYAQDLERDRRKIFEPILRYQKKVNSFLENKTIKVEDDGVLRVYAEEDEKIEPLDLSSGEKQIIILLTQALLYENKNVIYFIDEPELSLHVKWQEKLLPSLNDLGGSIQIIAATHSPDIAGPFRDKVINLSKV